jgi:hypothetical protein
MLGTVVRDLGQRFWLRSPDGISAGKFEFSLLLSRR